MTIRVDGVKTEMIVLHVLEFTRYAQYSDVAVGCLPCSPLVYRKERSIVREILTFVDALWMLQ